MMKIEQCIEDFMNSIVKGTPNYFVVYYVQILFLAFVNECIRIKNIKVLIDLLKNNT